MALLAEAYTAYSSQDLERPLPAVTDDVDWPDGAARLHGCTAARLHGKDALRRFWLEQWTHVLTRDEPVAFEKVGLDVVQVRIDQVVRDLHGHTVSEGAFRHTFRPRDERITRLDIDPVAPSKPSWP